MENYVQKALDMIQAKKDKAESDRIESERQQKYVQTQIAETWKLMETGLRQWEVLKGFYFHHDSLNPESLFLSFNDEVIIQVKVGWGTEKRRITNDEYGTEEICSGPKVVMTFPQTQEEVRTDTWNRTHTRNKEVEYIGTIPECTVPYCLDIVSKYIAENYLK